MDKGHKITNRRDKRYANTIISRLNHASEILCGEIMQYGRVAYNVIAPEGRRRVITQNCKSLGDCGLRHAARGVATGCTGVDMSTPLLPEVVPEIDANPVSFYMGGGLLGGRSWFGA